MKIGRMVGPAIATHAALATGVHGVGGDNIISDAEVAILIAAEATIRETADTALFTKINEDIAAEETARDEAIGTHSDLVTGVHGVGGDNIISDAEADAKVAAVKTSGTYIGDGTVNKAIVHGLGVVPKLVLITGFSTTCFLFGADTDAIHTHTDPTSLAVTAMTTNNFYVGNATSYEKSANEDTYAYLWVAIG